jgi:hypothetical protein
LGRGVYILGLGGIGVGVGVAAQILSLDSYVRMVVPGAGFPPARWRMISCWCSWVRVCVYVHVCD